MRKLLVFYETGCPNCGGGIGEDRLEKGLPCPNCLPEDVGSSGFEQQVLQVGRRLLERGRLQGYWYLYHITSQLLEFEEFFRRATGGLRLWSAQRAWARRLLGGESIAIVAPTGVGKTTLLVAYGLYQALNGTRVYFLLPTENLVQQTLAKINSMASSLGSELRVAWYSSSYARRRREELLERIERGDYQVLVTTTGFLSRRWNLLENTRFGLILVDDVDAILNNSKNIERVLMLLGFSEEAVKTSYRIVKKKLDAMIYRASGRMKRYEETLLELQSLEAKLASEIASADIGQLVIASATGRARGLKPRMFRELLGFDIGRVYDYTRDITNTYIEAEDVVEATLGIVEKLVDKGLSGLVFVSKHLGKNVAKAVASALAERGVRAAVALAGTRVLDRFAEGELDVLVGVASYYGVIVRGLDLPQRVHFTVFTGVPTQKLHLEKALLSPYRLVRIASSLGIEGVEEVVKLVSRLSQSEAMLIRIALEKNEHLEGRLGQVQDELVKLRNRVLDKIHALMSNRRWMTVATTMIVNEDGQLYLLIPDAATYVQASGRASRMYGSAMTHGLSIVVERYRELIELLTARLRMFLEEAGFRELTEDLLEEEARRIRESRRLGGKEVKIETSLIIVESPTKAKTIARFFGKPVRRKVGEVVVYETTFYNPVSGKIHVASIAATRGHVFDLTIDDKGVYGVEVDDDKIVAEYAPIKQCMACGEQFASTRDTCPRCGSANVVSRTSVVDALRRLAMEVETIYIATDPDIEGEKIAYDMMLLLRPYASKIKRIELHEITRNELYRALASPREVSKRVAYAQVVRRIEDRWIGFGLSKILWDVFGKHWLGAGRVQTPVLGWIIERYNEWRSGIGYNVYIVLPHGLKLRIHVDTRDEAERIAGEAEKGLRVTRVEDSVEELNPLPPYTTESLIYDASRLLGYTSDKTMRLAQELFENGLITYHRTDSTHVSTTGMGIARAYLESKGLLNEYVPRAWGDKGHHEAIRPTMPIDAVELRRRIAAGELRLSTRLRESHYRLYDMIFRRFIASQMKRAKLVKTSMSIQVADTIVEASVYTASIEKGFTQVFMHGLLIPEYAGIKPGSLIKPERVVVRRGSVIKLYTHGDVVLMMKNRGIGRPSTYSRTIRVLLSHGYVIESKYRKYLVPTKLGREVYSFLTENYGELVSEDRTRQLYERIARIERGEVEAPVVVMELYNELSRILEMRATVVERAKASV